jgi:hypothetical protein
MSGSIFSALFSWAIWRRRVSVSADRHYNALGKLLFILSLANYSPFSEAMQEK